MAATALGFRSSDVLAPMRQDPKMEGIYNVSPHALSHKSDSANGATDLTNFQAYKGLPKAIKYHSVSNLEQSFGSAALWVSIVTTLGQEFRQVETRTLKPDPYSKHQ